MAACLAALIRDFASPPGDRMMPVTATIDLVASIEPGLLPFLELAAARIASLHPAKLLERRPVTLEQGVFLVRRRRHAPAKCLARGHCVRIPHADNIAAGRLRRLLDLLLCVRWG
jgi:hypothetical protein